LKIGSSTFPFSNPSPIFPVLSLQLFFFPKPQVFGAARSAAERRRRSKFCSFSKAKFCRVQSRRSAPALYSPAKKEPFGIVQLACSWRLSAFIRLKGGGVFA
jgi:hypothetical protein